MHGDAARGDVDGFEPREHEGNEDGLGGFGGGRCGEGELDGEEGRGVFQPGSAIGAGGKFDIDDGADGDVRVVVRATEEIAYEEGVGVERGELVGGDQELLAGQGLGVGDAVAAGELEDDAARVLAGGKPMLLDVDGRGAGLGRGCVRGHEEEVAVGGEDVGEVAEGFGEELTTATLRAQQTCEWEPAGF